MYAIIATGGKQYKVSTGDIIKVENLGVDVKKKVTFDNVLLVSDKEITVGTPTVPNAKVEATVVRAGKDKKIIVYKYKRKSGYHKKNGHRQLFTEVKIGKIVTGETAKAKAADSKEETATEKKPAAKKTTATKSTTAKKPAAAKTTATKTTTAKKTTAAKKEATDKTEA